MSKSGEMIQPRLDDPFENDAKPIVTHPAHVDKMIANLGHQRIFPTVQSLVDALNEYFREVPIDEWSVTGICLTLGIDKSTFYHYQGREEFAPVIDQARKMVEHSYERSLKEKGRAGDIFALKQFNWKDKQEVTTTHNVSEELQALVGATTGPTNKDD